MWFHVRILEACNLKCQHCYARNYDKTSKMSLDLFKDVIKLIIQSKKYHKDHSIIYISGGEPLLHPQLEQILELCYTCFKRIHILTNGILIEDKLSLLSEFRQKTGVQVSVEGNKKTNDSIRGQGTYEKCKTALRILNENNIMHWMSFTVSTINVHAYKEFVDLARTTSSVANNITPYSGDTKYMLSLNEWMKFRYNLTNYCQRVNFPRIHSRRACGFSFFCSEYSNGITINSDGTFTGCARNPEIRRPYKQFNEFISDDLKFIHQTCMKKKWKDAYLLNKIEQLYRNNPNYKDNN